MKNIFVVILMLISINVFSQSADSYRDSNIMRMNPYWVANLPSVNECKSTPSRFSLDATAGPNFPTYNFQNYEPGSNGGLSLHYNLGNDFNISLEERYTVNTAQRTFKTICFNTIVNGEYEIAFKHLSGGLLINLGVGAYHIDESIWAYDITLRNDWNLGVSAGTGFRVNFTELVDVVGRVRLNQIVNTSNSFLTTDIGLKFKF